MQVGAFILESLLGSGGMGEVWVARHAASGGRVAVKIQRGLGGVDSASFVDFAHEVRAVAALRHAHIVDVLDYGRADDDKGWLAMRLAEGTLSRRGPGWGWREVRRVLGQVLAGLAHAHAHGVVHCDLKPANVLLVDGRWVLADFGIALVGAVSEGERVHGTPQYMAPEQIRGHRRQQGPWTDLYALGCMTWELVSGAPPFVGEVRHVVRAHLSGELPELVPAMAVPRGLSSWLRRLLQVAPEERFTRAADAAWALHRLGAEEGRVTSAAVAAPEASLTWFDIGAADDTVATDQTGAVVGSDGGAGEPAERGLASRAPPPMHATWSLRTAKPPPVPAVGLGLFGLRAVPFVGRHAERDSLWAALREVRADGRARLALVEGEAGVGKTALAAWLTRAAHESGAAHVVWASFGETPGGLDGVAVGLRAWLRAEGLSGEPLVAHLARALAVRGGEVALAEPLAALLDGEASMTAGQRRELTARALAPVDRPVVLVLDDLHWGAEGRELVGALVGRAVPVLLVGVARTGALDEGWCASVRPALRLPLGPLEVGARMALLLGALDMEPSLAADLDARADGHPQRALALLAEMVETGALEPGEQGFRLRSGAEARLELDAARLAVERLDRALAGRSSEALEVAAALGPRVATREWRQVCARLGLEAPGELLVTLGAVGLVTPRAGGFAFAGEGTREALLHRSREGGRLAVVHREIAHVSRDEPARAGRHLLAAGDVEAGAASLLTALQGSEARGAPLQVLALTGTLAQALSQAGADPQDPRWGRVWLYEAMAYRILHAWEALTQRVERVLAVDLPAWRGLRVRARSVHATALAQRGHVDAAFTSQTAALDEARLLGRPHELGMAWSGLAQLHRVVGRGAEALQAAEEAIALLEGSEHAWQLATARLHAADALRLLGRLPEARGQYEAALEILRDLPPGSERARGLVGLSELAMLEGDVDLARRHLDEARAAYIASGTPAGATDVINQLAEIARRRGELDEAERGYREAVELSRDLGLMDGAVSEANLGLVLLMRGRWREAREVLDAAAAAFAAQGRGGWHRAIVATRLPCFVGEPEWSEQLAFAQAYAREVGTLDPDVAWAFTLAATRAEQAGLVQVAAAARAIVAR